MNLLMLAAVAKAIDNQNRSHRRRRRTGERAPSKGSSSYSSSSYSESEFLTLVISEDPILKSVFDAIVKKGEEIDKQDAEVIRKEIATLLEEQANRTTRMNEIKTKLEEQGVKLTCDRQQGSVAIGKKVTEAYEEAYGKKGEYVLTYEYFSKTFEGIELKSEWFTDENINSNPFEEDYNYWLKLYGDLDEKIKVAEDTVAKLERKAKYAVFGKERKEADFKRLKRELERLYENKTKLEEIKRKKDTFDKLTPEHKKLLKEYLENLDETVRIGGVIWERDKDYKTVTHYYYSYSYYGDKKNHAIKRNKWQRAIDALKADGELSEELLDAVDTLLAEEDIGYDKYSEGLSHYSYSSKGISEDCGHLIEWYLKERKEKIALKALKRKEAAYQLLEAEHKKLADAAGLVDKAEELENGDPEKKGDEKNGE